MSALYRESHLYENDLKRLVKIIKWYHIQLYVKVARQEPITWVNENMT